LATDGLQLPRRGLCFYAAARDFILSPALTYRSEDGLLSFCYSRFSYWNLFEISDFVLGILVAASDHVAKKVSFSIVGNSRLLTHSEVAYLRKITNNT
jgi:hypothetical protein